MHRFATPLFALGLLLAGAAAGYSQTYDAAVEADLKGEAAQKRGDLDSAIDSFSEAIDIDPSYALAYCNRGFAYYKKYDYDTAIVDLTEAIRLDPNSTSARICRADAFFSKHQIKESIADYSEAIRIDPKCTRAYADRADIYVETRNFKKALADCAEAIRIDPKDALGYVERAHVYAMQGNWDKLMNDAGEAMRVDPKSAKANNTLGIAFDGYAKTMMRADEMTADSLFDRASANIDGPLRKLDEAQEQLPFDGSIEHFRAAAKKLDRAHKAQLLFDYSAEYFKAAIEIQPDYDFANNNLGVYYARRNKWGDTARAEEYFRAALKINSHYPDAFNNLGIVLAEQGRDLERQGRFDEALAKLEDAAKQHVNGLNVRPDRASDQNNLCGALLEMGRVHKAAAEEARLAHQTDKAKRESAFQTKALDGALEVNDVTLKCDPNLVGAWQSRISILREQNKPGDTLRCYERIVKIDPTHDGVQALAALVAHYQEQKEPEQVAECVEKAGECYLHYVKGKPPSTEFISMPFYLANAYVTLKQPENAIAWLNRAVERLNAAVRGQPESPAAITIRFKLSILYLKLKRPDQTEKVVAWLNQVLAENSSWIDGYALREAAYEFLGNATAARSDAARVAKGKPQEQYSAARLFYDLEKPDKTIALLNPMLVTKLPPNDKATLLMLRSAAYEMKGDFAAAKADYERVKQIAPPYAGVQERLNAVNEKLQNSPK